MNPRDENLLYFARQLGLLSAEQEQRCKAQELSVASLVAEKLLMKEQLPTLVFLFVKSCLLQAARQGGYLTQEQCEVLLKNKLQDLRQGESTPSLTSLETRLVPLEFLQTAAQKLHTQGFWGTEEWQMWQQILDRTGKETPGSQHSPTISIKPNRSQPVALSQVATSSPVPASPGGVVGPQGKLGPYELIEEIGAGGMGRVFKAYHTQLDRVVALKVLHSGKISERERGRFFAEAKLTAKLKHPNIVTVYDVTTDNATDYIVMELIEGASLQDVLKRSPFSVRKSLEIIKDVALAIDYAHQQNIIHRDLKPANIMIEQHGGRPVVMDFGLAKDIKLEKDVTKSGEILGTPKYMSPEQAGGNVRNVSPLSDVYALGAILYEMLAGVPAVDGPTPYAIIVNIINKDVIPLRQRHPHLSIDLETICQKALEKEPSRRYASAGALAGDIERFLNGEVILARPSTLWHRCWKTIVRQKIGATVAAIATLLFLVGSVWGWYSLGQQKALVAKEYQEKEKKSQEQKSLAEWKLWWQDFHKAVAKDFQVLHTGDQLYDKAKSYVEQWWKQHEANPGEGEEVLPKWDMYNANLITLWGWYSGLLQPSADILLRYQNLASRYEQVNTALRKHNVPLQVLEENCFRQIPEEQRHYFFPDQQGLLSKPAKIVYNLLLRRAEEKNAQIHQYITAYKSANIPENLELARWLSRYVLAIDHSNPQSTNYLAHMDAIRQSQYRSALDLTAKISPSSVLTQADSSDIQQGFRETQEKLIQKTFQQLSLLCRMDCTFGPVYYQIARLYHQLGKKDAAISYYEKSNFWQKSFLSLYYLQQIYFYKWRENPQAALACEAKISQIQADLKESEEAKEYELLKMSAFYTNLIETEKRILKDGAVSDTLNFYLIPAYDEKKEADKAEQERKDGLRLYQSLRKDLETMPIGPFAEQVFYLRGQVYADLAVLSTEPEQDESYLERAIQDLEEAVRWQPFYPEAWQALAEAYYFLGDYHKATNMYDSYLGMLTMSGNPQQNSPWLIKNYWKYIYCLLNQSERAKVQPLLENYTAKWEDFYQQYKQHPASRYRLIRKYVVLMLLYLKNNETRPLEQLLEKMDKLTVGCIPGVETFTYALGQIRLQKIDAAKKSLERLSKIDSIAPVLTILRTFSGVLKKLPPYLENYEDIFCCNPKWRKMEPYLDKLLQQVFVEKGHSSGKFFFHLVTDPSFFRYAVGFLRSSPDLDREFNKIMFETSKVNVPLSVLFDLYVKGGIDVAETRLISMRKLPSAALYYYQAIAFYRKHIYNKQSASQSLIHKAMNSIRHALDQDAGEMKYHYAAAILNALLADTDAQYKENMYLHLELARQLQWERCDYTQEDPVFQSFKAEKRFQELLNKPISPLFTYPCDEIQRKLDTMYQQNKNYAATQLLQTYKAAVEKYLNRQFAGNKK